MNKLPSIERPENELSRNERPWYAEVTRYEWIVLAIASVGWVFDTFQGQLFTLMKTPMMIDLLGVAEKDPGVAHYGNIAFASFLLGGGVGGLLFGVMADRLGRRQAMVWSILMYSVFTGLHYFATSALQIVILRFFVAVGVAGEWAVAAAMVAEVFPPRARTFASGFFHASGLGGVFIAGGLAWCFPGNWRLVFLIGTAPALLVVWVLASLKESEKWQTATKAPQAKEARPKGVLRELLGTSKWRSRALLGFGLGTVGLATYWGIFSWAPELVREVLHDKVLSNEISKDQCQQMAASVYMIITLFGVLPGQLLFPLLTRFTNRRTAFAIYHLGSLTFVPITFLWAATYSHALILLTISSFFVTGMHSGYAIYFPELFPTRFRATGASFCFNGGRAGAAFMLIVSAMVPGLRYRATIMASLFLVGLILLWFAPETKGQQLPE